MGEVYLATQLSLNRPVALKVLLSDLFVQPDLSQPVQDRGDRGRQAQSCRTSCMCTMLGCVDKIHFIAMEYVQGTNLRDYIIKKGALDLPLAFSIMRQTGQAIGAAGEDRPDPPRRQAREHLDDSQGAGEGRGLRACAATSQAGTLHVTQSGVTMGTPLYMSPEQAQGHAVDHRSDLYSLGVTFYHMLAGEPPFRADTALAVALKQVREAPRSMLVHRPDLPVELDRLVLKLMAKTPGDRYQSAARCWPTGKDARLRIRSGRPPTVADPSQDSTAATEPLAGGSRGRRLRLQE